MATEITQRFDIYTAAADGTDVQQVSHMKGGGFPTQVDWGSAPIVAN